MLSFPASPYLYFYTCKFDAFLHHSTTISHWYWNWVLPPHCFFCFVLWIQCKGKWAILPRFPAVTTDASCNQLLSSQFWPTSPMIPFSYCNMWPGLLMLLVCGCQTILAWTPSTATFGTSCRSLYTRHINRPNVDKLKTAAKHWWHGGHLLASKGTECNLVCVCAHGWHKTVVQLIGIGRP